MSSLPGRGLEYARVHPAGIEALCDCGTTTILVADLGDIAHLGPGQDTAFTCDGCGSVHWLTLLPLTEE